MEKIEILNPRWEEVMRDEVVYMLLIDKKSGWLNTNTVLLSFILMCKN
jgi:hypothetical protein